MTTIQAQKILFNDVKSILEAAGLKNGLGADKDGILYYSARKDSVIPNADTFVTYEVYSIQAAGKADDKTFSQIGTIAIDVFTKKDRTSSSIMDMLLAIEQAALTKGYEMEIKASDSYDSINQLTHLSYDITKRLK